MLMLMLMMMMMVAHCEQGAARRRPTMCSSASSTIECESAACTSSSASPSSRRWPSCTRRCERCTSRASAIRLSLSLSLSLSRRVSALTSRSCSIIDNKFGKPTIDWHDAQALLELTTTLLWHCYSIRMVMPHTVEVEQLSLGYDVHKACQRKGAVLRITCRDRRTSLSSFPLVSLLLRVCGPRSTHCWPRQCTCRLYTSSPTCLQCLPRFLGLQDNQETGRRREGKDGDIAARSAFLIHRTHIRRIIVVTRERHPLRASDCCRC